jgi:hypothetical protein
MTGHLCQNFFLLWANDRAEWVDSFWSIVRHFLLRDAVDFIFFKLPTFWLLDFVSGSRGWLKQKGIFSGKTNRHTVVCCAYKVDAAEHVSSHHFLLLCCIILALHSMATDSVSNPLPANPSIDDDAGDDSEVESMVMTNSSSPTRGTALMAKGEISELTDFFKGTTISEEELQAYHSHGWLTGNVLSSIPEVDVPTIAVSTVLCFESHLLAGLGFLPSKFLAAIMNYLGCSLVHFNTNAIAALSNFIMLCECWLGILLDSSLFWYYYSPSSYTKFIYGGIELSLRRHHHDEYIPALFKGCWKHSQKKWFLVDMHVQPLWENKLLFPPFVKAQRTEPPMNA